MSTGSLSILSSGSSNAVAPKQSLEQKYNDALRRYYQLKTRYEDGISSKKKMIKRSHVSNKEKRDVFRKFVPVCVSCGRNVGTTFTTTTDKYSKTYLAKCGDVGNPCQLDIELKTKVVFDIRRERTNELDTINAYGEKIIRLTNDGMFGYITADEVVDRDDTYEKERLAMDVVREALMENRDMVSEVEIAHAVASFADNKTLQRKLHDSIDLFNEHVATIKTNMVEYARTGNRQFIRDGAHLYTNEMRVNLNVLNHVKYAHMAVEYTNQYTREYVLHQDVSAPSSWLLDDHAPQVVRFSIGKKLTRPERAPVTTPSTSSSADLTPSAIPSIDSAPVVMQDLDTPATSSSYHPASDGEDAGSFSSANTDSIAYVPDDDDDDDDDSDNDGLPRLRIGSTIDSSDDGFVPPPPPPDELEESSSDGFVPPPPPDELEESSSEG